MNPIANVFGKAEGLFRKLKKNILLKSDKQYYYLNKWYKEDPRNLKRSSFNYLDENSIVFDLGGYEGQWSSDIYSRYSCDIHIFEPVKEYADIISERFKKNNKIKVHYFGLDSINKNVSISIGEFASSINNKISDKSELIELKSFNEFISSNQISHIDLIKINIEGAEYDLLDFLIRTDTIHKISCLLIQFHNFIQDSENKRNKLRELLSKTHSEVFNYPFVWECWQIKK